MRKIQEEEPTLNKFTPGNEQSKKGKINMENDELGLKVQINGQIILWWLLDE